MKYCQVCQKDNNIKAIANFDIEIIEWEYGKCSTNCSIYCTIIHEDPKKNKYYLCKKHHLEFKRELNQMDV